MSTLDEALDALDGPGVVEVEESGGKTTVDVTKADSLGVRIKHLEVGHARRSPGEGADGLVERVRAIPGKLKAIEVDDKLGGAILRTDPDQMRRGRFFELDAQRESTGVRRFRVTDGERNPEDFTLTRDQLRDLVDEIRGGDPH